MKKIGKQILYFGTIVIVSAAVSTGTFKYLEKRSGEVFYSNDSTQIFAKPVGFNLTNQTQAFETDFTVAAEKTVNAVVHIKSTVKSNDAVSSGDPFFDLFFGNRQRNQTKPQEKVGYGSGVIISSDGYIVTNNHVIDSSDDIEIIMNSNKKYKAVLVGTDPTTDIALLKVDAEDLPVISFGDSDALKVGEWVLAVGNPFMLNSTVTAGIVSAKARSIGIISGQRNQMGIESFIQTDAAVNPGNSGGALVNLRGDLVGINTAIFSQTGNYAGYSFAVPSSIVSKVVTDLKQYGTVQRAVLGIEIAEMTDELSKEKNIKLIHGIYVHSVKENGAAALGGVKDGDIITAVNGIKVRTVAQLQEQVSRYRPGDKIQITYDRNGSSKSVAVVLKNTSGNTEVVKQQGIESLGASLKDPSDADKSKLAIRYGVQVESLSEGKFKQAGIKEGFIIMKINDIRVTSPKEVEKIYKDLTSNKRSDREPVMFIAGLYPNGKTAYYAIDVSK